jgi:hypothetical protein
MVSGKREKRKRRTKGKGRGVSQNVGGEEGASEREAREKTRFKAWRERDGAASCRRRRVRGRLVRGTHGVGHVRHDFVRHDLESFHASQKATVGTFPNSATFSRHTLYCTT